MSAMTEQITLSVWFFLKSLQAWSCASKTKDMGVLKFYWRVMGCQNYQKVQKFARFCKNYNFQVAVSQNIFILKGWFTIICKVCMVLFTETQNWVFVLNYLWFHWVLKMGQTSKYRKLWVENPFLKPCIFWAMLWNKYILHKSENMGRNSAEILKSNNLKIP